MFALRYQLFLALLLVPFCTTSCFGMARQVEPARQHCADQCAQRKNACVLSAHDAETVPYCDGFGRACLRGCTI